jgi:hypothetical protein
MAKGEEFWVSHMTDHDGVQIGAGVLTAVHSEKLCTGRNCVLHNPSDHLMKNWPLNWRADKKQMERLCPHNAGHPDPDDVAWHVSQGRDHLAIHGCDGCCRGAYDNYLLI